MGYIIGNEAGIHLILSTGHEYTFNFDDPKACNITALRIDTPDDKLQAESEEELATEIRIELRQLEAEPQIPASVVFLVLQGTTGNLLGWLGSSTISE